MSAFAASVPVAFDSNVTNQATLSGTCACGGSLVSAETPAVFDDGEALLEATGIHRLEGVVAKKRSEPCRPGERGWVKVKHRDYWRFGEELALARRRRTRLTI